MSEHSMALRRLTGRESVELLREASPEAICRGELAVFFQGPGAAGRRYLFSLAVGQSLLPMPIASEARLTAVPLGEVELSEWSAERLEAPCADELKPWLAGLAEALGSLASPKGTKVQRKATRLKLKKGRAASFELEGARLVVEAGSAQLYGLNECALRPEDGAILLPPGAWLLAEEDATLRLEALPSIKLAELRVPLAAFEGLALRAIDHIDQLEQRDRAARLRDKSELAARAMADSLTEIAAVLSPCATEPAAVGAPHFIALARVARRLGVEAQLPSPSTDLEHLSSPIVAIAEASKLRIREVLLRDDWWRKDAGPLVGALEEGDEPVALLPVEKGGYELVKASGEVRQVDSEIALSLKPVAVMVYRPLPAELRDAAALGRESLRRQREALLSAARLVALVTLLGLLPSILIKLLVGTAIPSNSLSLLVQMVIGLIVSATCSAGFTLAQSLIQVRAQTLTEHDIQAGLLDRLLRVPVSFFRRYSTGEVTQRLMGIQEISRLLSGTTSRSLIFGSVAFMNVPLLIYYSWQLALVALGVALADLLITGAVSIALFGTNKQLLEQRDRLHGLVIQLIAGVAKLQVAASERQAFATWGRLYAMQQRLALRVRELNDVINLWNSLRLLIANAVLFMVATKLLEPDPTTLEPAITTGDFMAFNGAFGILLASTAELTKTLTDVLQVLNLSARVRPILAEPTEVSRGRSDPGTLRGKLSVEAVSFRYFDEGPLILDKVSIEARPGEFIALVGPSGSGKSTIIRLLLGFEQPESGAVFYDDQDLAGLDLDSVRHQLGVVVQQGRLTAGSIFENIASGRSITVEEAWEATKIAGIEAEVQAMPMKLHTNISEGGGNISGGQRQRLLIARAMVVQPRLLIFDEATSALDNNTQKLISDRINQMNLTRIVIAHRLSTIREADRIYVIDKGQVVEQGSYQELSARGGLFSKLAARQEA